MGEKHGFNFNRCNNHADNNDSDRGWYFGAKKDREKTRQLMEKEIQSLKDDVTDMGANLQQKVALIDLQIGTLSERVEKHNTVIERTYKLEQKVEDIRIKVG